MSGKESKCANQEEEENSVVNLRTECSEEKREKQYMGSNVLDNSQKEKIFGGHLAETAKCEQVKQKAVSDFAGEKDKRNINRNVGKKNQKKPVDSLQKLHRFQRDLPYMTQADLKQYFAKENYWGKLPFLSNFDPLQRKSEDKKEEEEKIVLKLDVDEEEEDDEEDEEEEEKEAYDKDAKIHSSYKLEYIDPFVIYVAAPSLDIPPPAPPPISPPPPPPDLLDDSNPDTQQQHTNVNHNIIENDVFDPNILNPLPPQNDNPAPTPPDHLE